MTESLRFGSAEHLDYLRADAARQVAFFKASLRGDGGFDALNIDGTRRAGPQELHVTTRMVHSYVLAKTAGFSGCDDMIDAGMQALWRWHRDEKYGGYFWSVDGDSAVDDKKLAYGHVFVLLAASSATMVEHPDAARLFADCEEILEARFWDTGAERFSEEYLRDWSSFSNYRGMNANMHGVEACLAAFEATGRRSFLKKAENILSFFILDVASQNNWRIPEHYSETWQIDHAYQGDPMFRPRGTTPGHSFEFARLLLQFWDLSGRQDMRWHEAAFALLDRALGDAWDSSRGGFVYTLGGDGRPKNTARYWWPVTEAIGAVASVLKLEPTTEYHDWYERMWQFADAYLVDDKRGGWFPELGSDNRPSAKQFVGKPDIYHALQADLLPAAKGLSRLFDDLARAPLRS